MTGQLAFDLGLTVVTAHCFFYGSCKHSETGDPETVHDTMETHYETAHAEQINRIIGWAS